MFAENQVWRVSSLLAVAVSAASSLAQSPQRDEVLDRVTVLEQRVAQQQKIIQQQAQMAGLHQVDGRPLLTGERAEEMRALINEAILDAESRSSLLADEATAGYDKGFFIANADNTFRLRMNVEGQFRYIFNSSDQNPGTDENVGGFVTRRTRVDLRGHAFEPALTFRVRLNVDRANGNAFIEYAYLGYDLNDAWNVKVGQIKPLFLREEQVNAFRQLAVERSYTADYFTVDFTQGAELTYDSESLRLAFSAHDGSYAPNSEFNADRTDIAFVGRADWRLAGDWKQFDDFTSWSGDDFGALIGVAAAYELGESGATDLPDVFKYGADVSLEFGGANLFASMTGQQFQNDEALPGLETANQWGVVVQGGVFLVPDKIELFGRYEWIDFDGFYYRNSGAGTQGGTGALTDDQVSMITIGANWYFRKHNLKLSVDVLHALDPIRVANTGAGILRSPEDGQTALRTQLQWSF